MGMYSKVTLFVYSYNHEKFIKQAIEGAFAQDYDNLEIILSDDCSTDRTFNIMKGFAENYTGPHKIILNRNEHNLGITNHLNKIMSMGNGDWFVLCAGDDVSLPDRVSKIMDVVSRDQSIFAVNTSYNVIDEHGFITGCHGFKKDNLVALGATGAWSKTLFDYFGPITHQTIAEDEIIPVRAILLGKLLLMNYPAILYRQHIHSISSPTNVNHIAAIQHMKSLHIARIGSFLQRLDDLETAYKKKIITEGNYEYLCLIYENEIISLKKQIHHKSIIEKVYQSSVFERLKFLIGMYSNNNIPIARRVKIFLLSFEPIYNLNRKIKSKNAPSEYIASDIVIDINYFIDKEHGLLMWQ